MAAAAKKKDCEILRDWVKSIVAHVYWVGAEPDLPTRLAKWTSVVNHVQVYM